MKILIVEDDFFARRLLVKYLSPIGEIDVAVNGREAINAVQDELNNDRKYDLICLDIMMPELDGHHVLQCIRRMEEGCGLQKGEGSKIFMTTALCNKGDVVLAAVTGCDAYLIKPINRSKLLEELENHGIACF